MVVYIPTTISGSDNDSADESFFRLTHSDSTVLTRDYT